VFAVGDDRHDAAVREVDVLYALVAYSQRLANGKINGLKMRLKQAKVSPRQA
jgi:hypothetical protein